MQNSIRSKGNSFVIDNLINNKTSTKNLKTWLMGNLLKCIMKNPLIISTRTT